jgi:hypothetical protein
MAFPEISAVGMLITISRILVPLFTPSIQQKEYYDLFTKSDSKISSQSGFLLVNRESWGRCMANQSLNVGFFFYRP